MLTEARLMISLKNVCKTFLIEDKEIVAVKNVDMTIAKGEFITITGPSKCGKSTLLNLLAGMETVSDGVIETDGIRIDNYKENQRTLRRRRKIGYIFQNYNLIDSLTAKENIELALQLNGIAKIEREKRAEELLKLVGIGKCGRYYPKQLLQGEKHRVAIARALANEPELILVDELMWGVDAGGARRMVDLLRKINIENHTTIIMVTNNPKLLNKSDRIIYMQDGGIVEDRIISARNISTQKNKKTIKKYTSQWGMVQIAYKMIFGRKQNIIPMILGIVIGSVGFVQIGGEIESFTECGKRALVILGSLCMMASGAIVINSYIKIVKGTTEINILRNIGFSKNQIRKILLAGTGMISCMAGALSVWCFYALRVVTGI